MQKRVDGTHGSARLAQSLADVKRHPWNASPGMLLGRLSERSLLRGLQTRDVRFASETHHLVVAAAGAGKYVSSLGVILRDLLLTDNASGGVVVVDPKGEALRYIGKMGLRPFGLKDAPSRYEIAWIDPFNVLGAGTWSLNPISHLGVDNPNASADAKLLSETMVEIASEKDSHWDLYGRNFKTALLMFVAQHPEVEAPRDLLTVRRISSLSWDVMDPEFGWSLKDVCLLMAAWKKGPQAAVTAGLAALDLPESTRQSFLMSMRRDSHWLDDTAFQRVVQSGGGAVKEIAAQELARKRLMVFVVIPDDYAQSHRGWLRLMVAIFVFYFRLYQSEQEREDDRGGGRNFSETGRRLMTPGEIRGLVGGESMQQLLLYGEYPPLYCSRYAVYWWNDYLRANPGKGKERFTLKEALEASMRRDPSPEEVRKFAWWRTEG
jgi:type IV secretory pathway TraG/TraD family ATPase VirD4